MKIIFTCSLKAILYFTLFFKTKNKEQWSNNVMNF